jgi:nucleotide-binding universal stress UspA family protein
VEELQQTDCELPHRNNGVIPMPKKILCATDGSDHSNHAADFAAQLAKQFGAELIYLIVNPVELARGTRRVLFQENDVRKALESAAQIAKTVGVKDIKCSDGSARDVAGAIVAYAENNDVDHVVVGSSGKGAASRLFIGSVSTEVVNKAHCPVTVVR